MPRSIWTICNGDARSDLFVFMLHKRKQKLNCCNRRIPERWIEEVDRDNAVSVSFLVDWPRWKRILARLLVFRRTSISSDKRLIRTDEEMIQDAKSDSSSFDRPVACCDGRRWIGCIAFQRRCEGARRERERNSTRAVSNAYNLVPINESVNRRSVALTVNKEPIKNALDRVSAAV